MMELDYMVRNGRNRKQKQQAKEKAKIQDYLKTKTDFESQKARIQNI